MTKFGQDLIASLEEAVAIAEGRMQPAGVIEVDVVNVAEIRHRLRLSQDQFARRFGLVTATVRDWEQGRRRPDRIATVLLRVIDHAPETVERAVRRSAQDEVAHRKA